MLLMTKEINDILTHLFEHLDWAIDAVCPHTYALRGLANYKASIGTTSGMSPICLASELTQATTS